MKLTVVPLLLSLAIAAVAVAADASSAPAAHKPTAVQHLALDLARTAASGDAALSAELKRRGVEAGRKHDEIVALVKAMRDLIGDGVVAGSAAFWTLLGTSPQPAATGVGESARGSSAKSDAAADLRRRGLARLAEIPRAQRDVFLDYNLLDQSEDVTMWKVEASGDRESRVRRTPKVTFAMLNSPSSTQNGDGGATRVLQSVGRTNSDDLGRAFSESFGRAEQLLVRLGYNSLVESVKVGGPPPTREQELAVTEKGLAAVDTPPALEEDARLRNAGISFAFGAGIIRVKSAAADGTVAGNDKTITAILARWNLIQRKATAKWNQRVGQNNPDGYALLTHYGRTEYALPNYDVRDRPYPRDLEKPGFVRDVVMNVTFFGPFIGTAALGEELPRPGATAGEKDRPYLVGWSLGFGYFDEASSLVYFDIGKTVSPRRGFDDSRLYYGFSCDGVVFQKIFAGTRKTTIDLKL